MREFLWTFFCTGLSAEALQGPYCGSLAKVEGVFRAETCRRRYTLARPSRTFNKNHRTGRDAPPMSPHSVFHTLYLY